MRNYIKIKKQQIDICNICMQKKELCWDHVPPRGVNPNGAVYASTFFDKFPSESDYGKKYQNGIKYRTICKQCNNVVLGKKDDSLKEFEIAIAENLIAKRKELPLFFEIDVPINKICKSICGHILAAKESIDECVIDERLRQYVLSENTSAKDYGIRIFYWLYLYNTICIMRDVMPQRVIGGTFENELPTNVISFFHHFRFRLL